MVLIDSRATHKFVSKELVKQLSLETDKTHGYSVLTAGGITFKGAWMCSELELVLPGCTITSSFLNWNWEVLISSWAFSGQRGLVT